MASSNLPRSHKRTKKSHDATITWDDVANKQHDLELEQRCKDHIGSLRLSAEQERLDLGSFNGVDWLKEEAPWPPDVQRRVHRYMHEKNLYQVNNLYDPAFVTLVDLVKSQAGVPNTRNWEQKAPDKCRGLINASTRSWERDGFLVTHCNLTRKTEVFQYLWDCATQAAQVSYSTAQSIDRAFPRGEPVNTANLVDFDLMTRAGWSPGDSHSGKRSPESVQQSRSPSSAKRPRVEQSNVRKDSEGDSIDIDCDIFFVTSPERDLADEVSAAARSGDRHHTDANITATLWNGLEFTIMTAQEALLALSPTEEGGGSLQEGTQLSQKKMSPNFATEPTRDLAPSACSVYENYQINATSWSPSHSNPVHNAVTIDGLDQAASPKPMAGPNTNQGGTNSSRVYLPLVRQTANRDVTNMSPNPVSNNGHVISSSKPHEVENNLHNSNSISRLINPSLNNAPETSQGETRYYSLTAQTLAQVSQTLSPLQQPPPCADRVQSSPSIQSGERLTSPGESDVISKNRYSPTPSENSESSNCSDRVVNAPHVAAIPQNSSQNVGDSQIPLERRFNQSLNTAETATQRHPPPRITDQDRDTQSTRLGPPGPSPPPSFPLISPQRRSAPPPPPPTSSQNAFPNGPPPQPPRCVPNPNQSPPPAPYAPYQNLGPTPPVVSRQIAWPNGPPPPSPPQRTSNQNRGPPPPSIFQNVWQTNPPEAFDQNRDQPRPPLVSPQNQTPSAPPPPPPPISQNTWLNGPPPHPPQALYHNQRPPPPSIPPFVIPQYQIPPTTPPPVQCEKPPPSSTQGPPSSLAASTQPQNSYPTGASNSVAGPPPDQFQSLGQQQPSSSPPYSGLYIGQPPPTPTQNQPAGPSFADSSSASVRTYPNPTHPTTDARTAWMLKKFNDMIFVYVPNSVQPDTKPDANLINIKLMHTTRMFPASYVLRQTVAEIFQWFSGLFNTALPSQLVFQFINVELILEARIVVPQGDSKVLETVKDVAWRLFTKIASLDPAVANVNILIVPIFSAAFGSRLENMLQQSQQLHLTKTASTIPSDQPPYPPLPNQSGSSIASDSTRCPPTTKSGGPPPRSQSSFFGSPTPDTINSHGGPPKLAPSSMPTPYEKITSERNVLNSNENIAEAHQSQQQAVKVPAPNSTKTDVSHSTAKIVIRIQIDGHGRLSRSYDKSTLNTRITSTGFFAWFAQETGHTCSSKLRFDFKDALPAKSSVIEAGNDDHFDLMVCDIKRKFERAKNFAPDLNEFCIVVTDPLWDSGDEDDDE